MANITPRRLPGFIELEPMKQLQFDEMIDKIKGVFQLHCFVPLDTPVLELSEILLAKSGGDIDKEIYRFSKGSTDMCMRYDFTVPLARYVAMNINELSFPFKRYQIGKVYRGERPQKGRLREFYQCDADIIGSDSLPLPADAECIALYKDCFNALGLNVVVEISDRNLLNGLIESLGLQDKTNEILVLLDKIDKIGKENVVDAIKELSISANSAEKLVTLVSIKGSLSEVVGLIKNSCNTESFVKGLNNLKEIDSYLNSFGVSQENYIFNLGIIRGHNYYTGTVFEAYLKDNRQLGALGGGGRFENLAGYYTDKKLPGVGMSIGLSRLYSLLSSNNLLPKPKTTLTKLLIIPLGETINTCISISTELIKNNINAEVAFEQRSFKNKLKEANKRQIENILIVGEDEVNSKKYTLKNMSTGTQESLGLDDIINKLRG